MYAKGVEATTTKTSLKALMETAGKVFPNDHANSIAVSLLIDPTTALTETVEVLGKDSVAGDGILLSTDITAGVTFDSFRVDRLDKVFLLASTDTVHVRCQIETDGR
jgi:hypothetical protein